MSDLQQDQPKLEKKKDRKSSGLIFNPKILSELESQLNTQDNDVIDTEYLCTEYQSIL